MKKSTILVGGFKFADTNLGTDENNPYGKLYNWKDAEAIEACLSGWRLPTKEEWNNFLENTNHEWIEDKEAINGMKFTDKVTGSSIFFPAMGVGLYTPYEGITIERVGTDGHYWSSTSPYKCAYSCYVLDLNYKGYATMDYYCHFDDTHSVRFIQDIESEK